jgi:hypothetical protein
MGQKLKGNTNCRFYRGIKRGDTVQWPVDNDFGVAIDEDMVHAAWISAEQPRFLVVQYPELEMAIGQ